MEDGVGILTHARPNPQPVKADIRAQKVGSGFDLSGIRRLSEFLGVMLAVCSADSPNQDEISAWAGSVNWNMAPRGTFALAHNRP